MCAHERCWLACLLASMFLLFENPRSLPGQDRSLSTEDQKRLIAEANQLDDQYHGARQRGAYRDALAAEVKIFFCDIIKSWEESATALVLKARGGRARPDGSQFRPPRPLREFY
jgi:hypothetical protein